MGAGGGGTFAVHGACLRGVEATPVTVEVSMAAGLPNMAIVGMPASPVLEARSRIRCALRASGYDIPRQSITVSLTPSDMRKNGSGLDLPIAIAVLAVSGQIPRQGLDGCLFVGEVGLDGAVAAVRGEVAFQLLARDAGLSFIGGASERHVALAGVDQGFLAALGALRQPIDRARRAFRPQQPAAPASAPALDFADVIGQELAKRALAVAAAGELGLLMVGAPGSGKTMLARRMTSILPPLTGREQQEALCIHSVVDADTSELLAGRRPFRAPHHSISRAGLVGGGHPVTPGEISLAHGGVLFLDELAEFPAATLQALRQPLEEGCIRLVRADGAYMFPARFQLIAASNPCPCGYLGDADIPCRCPAAAVERYQAKLGGPVADRIDLILHIARPDASLLVAGAVGMGTAELRAQVERGRAYRRWREARGGRGERDGTCDLEQAVSAFALDDTGRDALIERAQRAHLTGRSILRLCRIARTIADMAEQERVDAAALAEGAMLQGRRAGDDGGAAL